MKEYMKNLRGKIIKKTRGKMKKEHHIFQLMGDIDNEIVGRFEYILASQEEN